VSGFEAVLADAGRGDFVYCDPPYAPLSRTASFANYTADGFTSADQATLCAAVTDACARGATVVLSNSSADEIVGLYSSDRARRRRPGRAPCPGAPDDQFARHGARTGRRADRYEQPAVAGAGAAADAAGSADPPPKNRLKAARLRS
jgi:hypothetical protein